jgi:uncharacterized protein YndB with AHSA1/START domain
VPEREDVRVAPAIAPPIRYSTYVEAPRLRVWEALVREWDQWFADEALIDDEVGRYRFHWEAFGPDLDQVTLEGPVVELVEGRRFVFDWQTRPAGRDRTRVAFDLEDRPPGTVLRVTESGYTDDFDDLVACMNCAAGWGEAITLLKFWVEHGVRYGAVPAPLS